MGNEDLQITSGSTPPSPVEQPQPVHQPHHHHLHIPTGKKLRQILRPNGRKVHVAQTPEEADNHRRRLSSVKEKPEEDYDVVLHGSAEHVEALRESHLHHESTREELRARYGQTYDEFERVHTMLDALRNELHGIEDHAVQLDASISKYGYSARLRTKDSPNSSSANSLMGESVTDDHESDIEKWNASRHQGTTIKFFRQPVVRQYFHKGLLWRAHETAEIASYELFVDLFYVGIIAISGDAAAEAATGQALLKFVVTFIMSWKFWQEIAIAIAWFDADDVIRRFCVLFMLVCLLGLTTNIAASWETTWTPLVAFYIAGRWFSALYYLWMAYLIPMVRAAMVGTALHAFLPGFLWIGTVYVELPNRLALIWIALAFDLLGSSLVVMFFKAPAIFPKVYREWARAHFEFYPGANIEHKIERTGAFITLVFGYSVVALLYQSSVAFGINAFFGKAVLGLIQAFSFNWLYFEVDSFNLHTHAIRRHKVSALVWLFLHLPAAMAFVLAGAALSKLVLAHDTSDADPSTLFETYERRSEGEISDGLRWYYCGGLAVTLFCMAIVSLMHVYKDIPNQRLSKYTRLVSRFVIALIILFLPFAHGLDSLELIATTTCLTVFSLAVEIYGASCTVDPLVQQNRHCTYSARCGISRKRLVAGRKDGEAINVEELGRQGHAEHNVDIQI